MYREVGSCSYVAPEVLEVAFGMRPSGYSCACDLWSLGAVTYEMMCGRNPFWGDFDSMMSESLGFEEEQWIRASDDCKDIIVSLLRPQAENRLSIDSVFQHSFLIDARAEWKCSQARVHARAQREGRMICTRQVCSRRRGCTEQDGLSCDALTCARR